MKKTRRRYDYELSDRFAGLRGQWRAAVAVLVLSMSPIALPQAGPASAGSVRQAGKLQLHQPVERELGPGQTDVFTVDVAAGQFAHIVAEQKGVDVVVTIAGPDGKVLVTVDSPNYTLGPEPASWVARDSGGLPGPSGQVGTVGGDGSVSD